MGMTDLVDQHVLLRVYMGENDRFEHQPLYQALVEFFRREGCAGATVLRGVAGFGAHSVYHTDRLLRLSSDLPLVLEVVDSRERLEPLIPRVESMMDGGMITLEQVSVWHCPQ